MHSRSPTAGSVLSQSHDFPGSSFPIEPAMTGLSVFLPPVPVDVETAGQLEYLARAEGMTLAAYIRQVLAGFTTGYLEVIEDGPD